MRRECGLNDRDAGPATSCGRDCWHLAGVQRSLIRVLVALLFRRGRCSPVHRNPAVSRRLGFIDGHAKQRMFPDARLMARGAIIACAGGRVLIALRGGHVGHVPVV